MKHIAIVTPCYNEEGNVREMHKEIAQVLSGTTMKSKL